MTKLTEEQAKAATEEYNRLTELCVKQTKEQCEFLIKEIMDDDKLTLEQISNLCGIVHAGGFKLKVFRLTDANVLQRVNTQVTYDIHDDLFAYLRKPDSELPKKLVGFLDGGIDITGKSKDLALDPTKLTGKTKTGVPELDAILARQKKL